MECKEFGSTILYKISCLYICHLLKGKDPIFLQQECYYIGENKNGAKCKLGTNYINSLCSELDPLLNSYFFKLTKLTKWVFLLEDMYFLLEAKGLNDNGYLLTN
jgi:hypothetical protein